MVCFSLVFNAWVALLLLFTVADDTSATESVSIREEALKMISGGLENKMLTVLDKLLSSTHPEQMVLNDSLLLLDTIEWPVLFSHISSLF